MLSNLVLQSTMDGLHVITRREFFVLDSACKVLFGGNSGLSNFAYLKEGFLKGKAESQLEGGCQHFKVFDGDTAVYVLVVRGADDEAYRIGKMAAFQLQGLVAAYAERFDHANFVKQLLLGGMLPIDVLARAKGLNMDSKTRRVVLVAQASTDFVQELSKSELISGENRDFVLCLKQNEVIIVKELAECDGGNEIAEYAGRLAKTLGVGKVHVRVGVSAVCAELVNLPCAYNEAATALEIGIIYDKNAQNPVTCYNKLGIARLMYNLPKELRQAFADDVLQGNAPDFDEETLTTVDKFFENDLNVSETARKLYIHRNTLVYRLDKLQKMTGLDVRKFEDAIAFKLVLMTAANGSKPY